jgi:transposase
LTSLKRLGIDEISLRKGQQDFIVVLVDLDRHKPVGFVSSRKHKDIKKVLSGWGLEVLDQIIEVSIDLSGSYRGLVKKMMPNADIVADRFHVMKLVNDELNSVIINTKRSNKLTKDETTRKQVEDALKRSKYAILKPEENLTELQKAKLEEVRRVCPVIAEMHRQKEEFRSIFETATDWSDGILRLLDWLVDAEKNFPKSAATIKRWLGEITGYFDHQTTSGVVEGINNRLKLIKRLGYGFRNFDNFALRCLICWHLDLSPA